MDQAKLRTWLADQKYLIAQTLRSLSNMETAAKFGGLEGKIMLFDK